jgi:hypothetical protein
MEIPEILNNLKELTLDFVDGKRTRQTTVEELHRRINGDDIFKMDASNPQMKFIIEIYVSLDHLTEEGFATSTAEMRYLAECFEGARTFSQEEVRKFPIGDFEKDNPHPKGKSPSPNPKP